MIYWTCFWVFKICLIFYSTSINESELNILHEFQFHFNMICYDKRKILITCNPYKRNPLFKSTILIWFEAEIELYCKLPLSALLYWNNILLMTIASWIIQSPLIYYSLSFSKVRRKSRTELRGLDERQLIFELVKDICNELDVRSLCHKILQNVAILTNADRCSLFLVQGDKVRIQLEASKLKWVNSRFKGL